MKFNYKKYKYIIITIIIIIPIYFFVRFGIELGGGQYDGTEYYKFEIPKEELVSNIEKFKELNPFLKPLSNDTLFGNRKYDIKDIYSSMYFYIQDQKLMLITFLIGSQDNSISSSLGLYCVIDLKDTSYKRDKFINKNLGCSENSKLLKIFEDRIINPLREQINENKNRQ